VGSRKQQKEGRSADADLGLTRGERVVEFIQRFCRVPEGRHVGKPLKLEPFQRSFILETYDNPAGTRRAILSIARKNGKTAIIACIILAHLVGPEARVNAQLVSGARSREQAALVFDLACKIINVSPDLRGRVRIIPSGKKLVGLKMNVTFKALAAEASTTHGLSPLLAVLDELGQVRGPKDDFVDAITTGQGAYADPLLIVISTQAATDGDMLSVWIDDAKSSADPHTVCHVYEAPKDAALDDPAAWAAANPALGVFRDRGDVERQAAEALRMPSAESTFRNLTLNQRVTVFNPFIAREIWQANGAAPNEEAFRRGEVWAGLDLSETTDLTAFVMVAKWRDAWHVKSTFWMAADLVADRARADRVPYDVWAKQGHLLTTPGKSIDYEFVAAEIGRLCEGLQVGGVAFDRWHMALLKPHIERAEITLPFTEFGQGYKSMSPALQSLEIELLHNRIAHGNHPVLTMCASNAVVIKDPSGNRKLDKSKSTGRRIDGMVALAMAIGAATMNEVPAPDAVPSIMVLD
jgi:phage terminase large subunit-like protein